MKFSDKLKKRIFWIAFTKIAFSFFVILIFVSFLIATLKGAFSDAFSNHFNNYLQHQNWISFFGIKFVGAALYGLYTANKNFK